MRRESTSPDLLAQMGYEPRDINFKQVMLGVFSLIGFFIATIIATIFLYSIFVPDWAKLGNRQEIPTNRRLPPHPQLQTDPRRDFELYRQAEDRTLEGKGYDGKTAEGISVEQAIDVIATEKGIAGIKGAELSERGTGYPGMTSVVTTGGHTEAGEHSGPSGQAEHAPGGMETHDGSTTQTMEHNDAAQKEAHDASKDAGHGTTAPHPAGNAGHGGGH